VLMMVLLTLFFVVIPNRPVTYAAGITGAVAAGLMIALLRRVFGFYVTNFPTYENVYGALSTIPIFLIWMYLSWAVVLLGAQIAATMSEWQEAGGRPLQLARTATSRLTVAVAVLARLATRARQGGAVKRRELVRAARTASAVLDPLLEELRDAGYLERTAGNAWVLARDLSTVTLHRLYRDLGLGVNDEDGTLGEGGWQGRLAAHMQGLRRRNADAMSVTLADLLADPSDEAPAKGLKSVS